MENEKKNRSARTLATIFIFIFIFLQRFRFGRVRYVGFSLTRRTFQRFNLRKSNQTIAFNLIGKIFSVFFFFSFAFCPVFCCCYTI